MSNVKGDTLRDIRTEDGTLFKITEHQAAGFAYIELYQYDGDKHHKIDDIDANSAEALNIASKDAMRFSQRKHTAMIMLEEKIEDWYDYNIETNKKRRTLR